MITIEKDEFTGLKKIQTPIFNLKEFSVFKDLNSMRLQQKTRKIEMKMQHNELSLRIKLGHNIDEELKNLDSENLNGFDLFYVEGENGEGLLSLRVYTMLFEDGNWPNWHDEWPFIVDGERISIESNIVAEFPTDLEFKVYNLPVDIFSKLSNSNEIKYSLRGKSDKIEGVLNSQYINVYKAFENLCFGDETEGKKLFEALELQKHLYKGVLDRLIDKEESLQNENGIQKEIPTSEKEDDKKFTDRIVMKYKTVGQAHSAIKEFQARYNLDFTVAQKQLEEKVKATMSEEQWSKWKAENKKGERQGLIFVGVILVVMFLLFKAC